MWGGGYLNGLKLSGVRDGALGVTPPPPLRKYNYLTEVVVFCNRNKGLRVGMGGIWFGAGGIPACFEDRWGVLWCTGALRPTPLRKGEHRKSVHIWLL